MNDEKSAGLSKADYVGVAADCTVALGSGIAIAASGGFAAVAAGAFAYSAVLSGMSCGTKLAMLAAGTDAKTFQQASTALDFTSVGGRALMAAAGLLGLNLSDYASQSGLANDVAGLAGDAAELLGAEMGNPTSGKSAAVTLGIGVSLKAYQVWLEQQQKQQQQQQQQARPDGSRDDLSMGDLKPDKDLTDHVNDNTTSDGRPTEVA